MTKDDDNQGGGAIDRRCQQLELKYDGSPEDKELKRLILAVWNAPAQSFKRKRALHELIRHVQNIIKNFWRDRNQTADLAFERDIELDPIIYLSIHIDEFVPTGKSIKTSLIGWLGFKVGNRLKDDDRKKLRNLQRKDIKQNPGDPKLYIKIYSLDAPVKVNNKPDESETIATQIPDESLTSLDSIISQRDKDFYQAVREYLTTDPDGKLQDCAMKPPNERCNCFTLVNLLYLREPSLNQTKAAEKLGLKNHDGLRCHWKRNCLPLLKEIAAEIAKKYENVTESEIACHYLKIAQKCGANID